jgi:hypothetical protein
MPAGLNKKVSMDEYGINHEITSYNGIYFDIKNGTSNLGFDINNMHV